MPSHNLGNHGIGNNITFQVRCGDNRDCIAIGDVEGRGKEWRFCIMAGEVKESMGSAL